MGVPLWNREPSDVVVPLRPVDITLDLCDEVIAETLEECEGLLAEAERRSEQILRAAEDERASLVESITRTRAELLAELDEDRRRIEHAVMVSATATCRAAEAQAEDLLATAREHVKRLREHADEHLAATRTNAEAAALAVRAAERVVAQAEERAREREASARATYDRLIEAGWNASVALQEERLTELDAYVTELREVAQRDALALLARAGATAHMMLEQAQRQASKRLADAEATEEAIRLRASTDAEATMEAARREALQATKDAESRARDIVSDAALQAHAVVDAAHIAAARLMDQAHAEADAISARAELATPAAHDPVGAVGVAAPPAPVVAEEIPVASAAVREVAKRGRLRRIVALVAALLLAVVGLRAFVAEPFTVDASSMAPLLHEGDRLVVNKLSYRFHDPRRGDVVVFEAPSGDGAGDTLVKRVVAVPGEQVAAHGGLVYVDDEPLDEDYLAPAVRTENFPDILVPDGTVFVLGDNRAQSIDSRAFGVVAVDDVIGRADAVLWPLHHAVNL